MKAREIHLGMWIGNFARDSWLEVRFGIRILLKNPGLTIPAVLILALGIGVNASLFSLVNTLLLKPVGIRDPEQVVGCYSRDISQPGGGYRPFSYPNYKDLQANSSVFVDLAAHEMPTLGVMEGRSTRRVMLDLVSANYFRTLGAEPFLGRTFTDEEEKPSSGIPVAVVSYPFWNRRGARPDVLGSPIQIGGIEHTIVGVAPAGFTGTTAFFFPEIWLPLGMHDRLVAGGEEGGRGLGDRENHKLLLVGRLRSGATTDQVNRELESLAGQLELDYPAINRGQSFMVNPLGRLFIGPVPSDGSGLEPVVGVFFLLTGAVLLITCLNLSNLLLARGRSRAREFAIRQAVGASWHRLIRQMLLESLLLSLAGGLGGLLVASWSTRILVTSLEGMLPMSLELARLDWRVVAALGACCGLAALACGLLPARRLSNTPVLDNLRLGSGQRRLGRSSLGTAPAVVVLELALATGLVTTAGFFIRGSVEAATVDLGISERSLLMQVDPGLVGYDLARSRRFHRDLKLRLAAVSGIRTVSFANSLPFEGIRAGLRVSPDGEPEGRESLGLRTVGENYFSSLGLSLIGGREFTPQEEESPTAPLVAILDARAAKLLWPQENALGKKVSISSRGPAEVVGIAPVIPDGLFPSNDPPRIYLPLGRDSPSNLYYHLLLESESLQPINWMAESVIGEVRGIDPEVPVLAIRSWKEYLDGSIDVSMVRTAANIFSIFGALSLLIAVVGVYGVQAFAVSRRKFELGVRMALGATRSATLGVLLRDGLKVTLIGLAAGLLLTFAFTWTIASFLYGVGPRDPAAILFAIASLGVASLGACIIPIWRALLGDPLAALRAD